MAQPPTAAFFDAIARKYDRVYARGRDELRASMARVLRELPPASRVLDLGVGTGRELPALLDAGHAPVGLDASAEMLAACARRARPIPLVQADLWAPLPWDAASFDAVIALHGTLAHAPDDQARRAFPREIARLLRRGGVFVAEVPTASWFEARARDADGAGGHVQWLGGGRGRFVDAATGAGVPVWLDSRDGWTALFGGVFSVSIDDGSPGELVIVGRL